MRRSRPDPRPARRALARAAGVALVAVGALAAGSAGVAQERVSKLGVYSAYSEARFDGWQRTSVYVPMRDGVRLAVDVLRPTKGGVPHAEPLPVLWTHHRYHRASVLNDTLYTILDWAPWLKGVIPHGYVVAAVDTRGGGASFGVQPGFFSREEAGDAYEITEWLAAQPWSDGNIGMYGRSYLGITQYFAAAEKPPHLKAIFPEMASFEWYDYMYPGGVFRDDFARKWSFLTWTLDESTPFVWYGGRRLPPAAPVDGDEDRRLWAHAIAEHRGTRSLLELFQSVPYRDSVDPATGSRIHQERSPWYYMDGIRESGVAAYHLAGWLDMFPRDAILWYENLEGDVPQKLVIGPWFHGQSHGLDLAAEHLRWFDYWLKGIDNGVMDEPPIWYYTMGAPEGEAWRSTDRWPLPEERPTDFWLRAGPTGTVASANDGLLATSPPPGDGGADAFVADYAATSGPGNRWANGYGGLTGYPDMTPNDRRGLTYTTEPLAADVEVTGHPVVRLWVESTADDGDFFVYLEEVDAQGRSHYVTEGVLRASHRAAAEPPYDYLGLPYHPSGEADLAPLPAGRPVELAFDLHPTSNLFDRGHRIRVTITAADRDNNHSPVLDPAPTVRVHRGGERASRITLPVIPRGARAATDN